LVFKSGVTIAVGAHPDDVELGCGGTIRAATKAGTTVVAVFLTKGELSGNPEVRCQESRDALAVLGVKDVYFGDFSDSEIPNTRAPIAFLEDFYNRLKPGMILTHSVNDMHQDHRQVGWLSMAAYRNAPRILAYETPRVTQSFSPTYFVDISHCVKEKWAALKCHSSQREKRYLTYESMVNLTSFRGSQVNLPYAEAFEVVRYVEKIS